MSYRTTTDAIVLGQIWRHSLGVSDNARPLELEPYEVNDETRALVSPRLGRRKIGVPDMIETCVQLQEAIQSRNLFRIKSVLCTWYPFYTYNGPTSLSDLATKDRGKHEHPDAFTRESFKERSKVCCSMINLTWRALVLVAHVLTCDYDMPSSEHTDYTRTVARTLFLPKLLEELIDEITSLYNGPSYVTASFTAAFNAAKGTGHSRVIDDTTLFDDNHSSRELNIAYASRLQVFNTVLRATVGVGFGTTCLLMVRDGQVSGRTLLAMMHVASALRYSMLASELMQEAASRSDTLADALDYKRESRASVTPHCMPRQLLTLPTDATLDQNPNKMAVHAYSVPHYVAKFAHELYDTSSWPWTRKPRSSVAFESDACKLETHNALDVHLCMYWVRFFYNATLPWEGPTLRCELPAIQVVLENARTLCLVILGLEPRLKRLISFGRHDLVLYETLVWCRVLVAMSVADCAQAGRPSNMSVPDLVDDVAVAGKDVQQTSSPDRPRKPYLVTFSSASMNKPAPITLRPTFVIFIDHFYYVLQEHNFAASVAVGTNSAPMYTPTPRPNASGAARQYSVIRRFADTALVPHLFSLIYDGMQTTAQLRLPTMTIDADASAYIGKWIMLANRPLLVQDPLTMTYGLDLPPIAVRPGGLDPATMESCLYFILAASRRNLQQVLHARLHSDTCVDDPYAQVLRVLSTHGQDTRTIPRTRLPTVMSLLDLESPRRAVLDLRTVALLATQLMSARTSYTLSTEYQTYRQDFDTRSDAGAPNTSFHLEFLNCIDLLESRLLCVANLEACIMALGRMSHLIDDQSRKMLPLLVGSFIESQINTNPTCPVLQNMLLYEAFRVGDYATCSILGIGHVDDRDSWHNHCAGVARDYGTALQALPCDAALLVTASRYLIAEPGYTRARVIEVIDATVQLLVNWPKYRQVVQMVHTVI